MVSSVNQGEEVQTQQGKMMSTVCGTQEALDSVSSLLYRPSQAVT